MPSEDLSRGSQPELPPANGDLRLMRVTKALRQLAGRGLESRSGAVVVHQGLIVGSSHSQAGREAHTAVLALAAAGSRAKGGALYVTEEPCDIRDASCTDAIIEAGIRRVIIGNHGAVTKTDAVERLRRAGVAVASVP